jgi:hypothetical protein
LVISLFFLAGLIFWVLQRRKGRLKTPDSHIAAGVAFCGGSTERNVILLLMFRVLNFLWLGGLSIEGWYWTFRLAAEEGGTYWAHQRMPWPATYTEWCFRLQVFYFLFASVVSAMHVSRADEKRPRLALWCRTVQVGLFEICLPASWLVTLVVFTMLDPFNVAIVYNSAAGVHFWNTVVLTIEYAANRLPIRAGHFILMLLYMTLYVIYSWSMKAYNWHWFRYWFQSLETPMALLWYPILALVHVIIYFALVECNRCKERRMHRRTASDVGVPALKTDSQKSVANSSTSSSNA